MQDINTIRKQPRNFKFEASWNVDEESVEIIQNTWQVRDVQNCSLGEVQDLLTENKGAYSTTGKVAKSGEPNKFGETINQIQKDIDKLMEMEDLKWKQRAKRN